MSGSTATVEVALEGRPIRVALLVAPSGAPERTAATRAVLAAGAELVATLATDDPRSFGERAAALRAARPDVVVVAARSREDSAAAVALAEALRLACGHQEPLLRVLAATDPRTEAQIRAAAAPCSVEGVASPTGEAGRVALVGAIRALRRETGTVLRDEALEAAAGSLARHAASTTLLVDVSGASTSLVFASPDGALRAVHVRPLGVGAGADRVVARGGLDRVRRWLPMAVDAPALAERVFNRARWPDAMPTNELALSLEMALAREAITHAFADAVAAGLAAGTLRAASRVVLCGRLALLPLPGQSLLVGVDGVGHRQVAAFARDRGAAAVRLGALAVRGDPEATDGAIAAAVEPLALVAALWPRRSVTLHVSDAGGRIDQRISRGAFVLIPSLGTVEVSASGAELRARGDAGALGVLADARGRPLSLPPRDAERLPAVQRWHATLDAFRGGVA